MKKILELTAYTPKKLLSELLPPTAIQELEQRFPEKKKIVQAVCSDIGTVAVYYRELMSLQKEFETFIQSLVKHEPALDKKKDIIQKLYKDQLSHYIQRQSNLIVNNISSYLLQYTEMKKDSLPSKLTTTLTEKNWAAFQSFPITIVDFWANWCQPCKILEPVFEGLAKQLEGKVLFGKVDVDKEPLLVKRYAVQSMPTIIIFKEGKEHKRLIGIHPESVLQATLEEVLKS